MCSPFKSEGLTVEIAQNGPAIKLTLDFMPPKRTARWGSDVLIDLNILESEFFVIYAILKNVK